LTVQPGVIGAARLAGRRRLLAVAVPLFGLALVVMALVPTAASRAAQGEPWPEGQPFAGAMWTEASSANPLMCSVTVISNWLAITAKHCGMNDIRLELDVVSASDPGVSPGVKQVVQNKDLDVEALFLKENTGLPVAPLGDMVGQGGFTAWGYGSNRSNQATRHLTRAGFEVPQLCPVSGGTPDLLASAGELCWQMTAQSSVCVGDSGGPIIQGQQIVAMVTTVLRNSPAAPVDCGDVKLGQALTVRQMQPWLNDMLKQASGAPGGDRSGAAPPASPHAAGPTRSGEPGAA
jgi:Trypsin